MWTIRPTRRQSCRGHPRKTPGRRAITDRSEPFGAIFRGRCRLPGREQAIAPFEAVAERSSAVLERPVGSRSTSQHVHIGISSAFDRAHRSRIGAASRPHPSRAGTSPPIRSAEAAPRGERSQPRRRHSRRRRAPASGPAAALASPPSRRPPSRQPHPNRFKMRRETTNRTRARAAAPRSARRPWAARRSIAPPTEETERRWEPSAISASWT